MCDKNVVLGYFCDMIEKYSRSGRTSDANIQHVGELRTKGGWKLVYSVVLKLPEEYVFFFLDNLSWGKGSNV